MRHERLCGLQRIFCSDCRADKRPSALASDSWTRAAPNCTRRIPDGPTPTPMLAQFVDKSDDQPRTLFPILHRHPSRSDFAPSNTTTWTTAPDPLLSSGRNSPAMTRKWAGSWSTCVPLLSYDSSCVSSHFPVSRLSSCSIFSTCALCLLFRYCWSDPTRRARLSHDGLWFPMTVYYKYACT